MNEKEVRKLRDNIYGPATDKCWEHCKEKWMTAENIEWLQKQPQNIKTNKSIINEQKKV